MKKENNSLQQETPSVTLEGSGAAAQLVMVLMELEALDLG